MAIDEEDRYRAPALDKGLDILELLAATEASLSQAEIAKSLERSPNEIYRMLDRLVRRDYVRRTEEDRYELTLKLFELSHRHPPVRRLVSQGRALMRRFSHDSEQACHLVIYDRNNLVVVAQVDSPGYWSVAIRVGSRIGLINTGSGHVLLAYADEEEKAQMLKEQDEVDPAQLPDGYAQRLDEVKAQGFESMQSLQVMGVTNLSVPIFGPMGSVIAVLTCPFTQRIDKTDAPNQKQVLNQLIEVGRVLSNRTAD